MELPRLRSSFKKSSGSLVIAHKIHKHQPPQGPVLHGHRSGAQAEQLVAVEGHGTVTSCDRIPRKVRAGTEHRTAGQVHTFSYHGGVRGTGWALFSRQDAWQCCPISEYHLVQWLTGKINQLHHHTLPRNAVLSLSTHRLQATTPGAATVTPEQYFSLFMMLERMYFVYNT